MTENQIRNIFDRIAPVYDRLNDNLSLGMHRIWKQMAINWSEAKPGDICLDVCCGSGDIALMLAKKVTATGSIYGVDFSPAQLAIARQRSENEYPRPPITWIEADALNLPFPDHNFDAVTMGYGLRNLTDIPRGLKEINRVLKPGAKAAILDFHRPNNSIINSFQQWYLQNLVIPTAKKFGMTEEYAYIVPSLEKFPTGPEQVELALNAGFTKAVHYPILGGMMGVLLGTN